MRDSEGQPTGFRGVARDITKRKEAEEAFRESEERYRSLFEESQETISITDQKGEFVEVNKAALDLFGYTREEISKASFKELYVDPKDRVRFQREAEAKGCVKDFEVNLKKKDGTVMTCLLLVTAKRENGCGIVGYQRDYSRHYKNESNRKSSPAK